MPFTYSRVTFKLSVLSRKQLFPVFVDCQGHYALDNAQIVSDGCGSEVWRHFLNQLFCCVSKPPLGVREGILKTDSLEETVRGVPTPE